MLKRWQIKYLFESLNKEHRLKNIKAVIDKYNSGFTNDKYDPVYTKKQAFCNALTLLDCVRLARESKKKLYTAGIDVGIKHLYNDGKFKDAYLSLKQKAKEFEKKLKKADSNISYFKKLEVLLNADNALYEVHYHYIISAENEINVDSFENYFEPVYKDTFSTYSYFTKEWITVQSEKFITKKNLEGKLAWSRLPLGKDIFGIVKDFIAKSYDALRRQSVYRYYGEFQTYNKNKQDKAKEEKSDYVLQVINLGDAGLLPVEKTAEYQKYKQLEYMRLAREKKKKIEQVKKFTGHNVDDIEIVVAPPVMVKPKGKETDLDMDIPRPSKEQIKQWKEEKKVARKKSRESEFKFQLRLFKSRDEIEREEIEKAKEKAKEKAEEWLDTMFDFFTPSEEEVEETLKARNERLARLQVVQEAIMQLSIREQREYITESKIKAITAIVLNWIGISRLNQNMLLYGFNFALELIGKTRLGLSIRLFETQEKKYWKVGTEKVKKVVRPPPYKIVPNLLIEMELFLRLEKKLNKKIAFFSLLW